ncbi:MAG: hypothetical protein A2504_01945 [Bdellovibrionales bacterium RIFOXYD12_FULL_39_22]|nr:MAG: hypothetical protein A2385_04470 [Bdellovibrionales bacterium RIFOXYB1_FULL_39_21]OFZ42331.1 MAG: hypothetical protein A2485_15025 [Bdellovibrionales bacterium RIFOXYC12_FULL_39_17]OFZ46368.1 MAG: hypothetical protein A2404_13990 [Bdellovibrionales bacterium RIFOXYC1_FULL_39_130]OFZ72845.1 MAG: hypothetical protein A2451_10230 [Bdellovibrionales bacterium RIFOXYC2_FULL_39_8]OFZ75261.1 MAG: hypothetical protein A2560_16045 [Bdellovibrionales bacterium RIFOXYD1_FULL_39_84]OFZ93255.1 MAG:
MKKIVAVITAITGDRIIVSDESLNHAIREHFQVVPKDILLEILERILKDPTEVYCEEQSDSRSFNFFYRLENRGFIVVVVKIMPEGAFMATMYPTGKTPRNKHKILKKVKL